MDQMKKLEVQYGGEIPFSALKKDKKRKTKKKKKKKSNSVKKKKKKSISPARARRINAKKTKRSKKKTVREKKSNKCSCGSHTYTGKEKSPTGFGKCSECTPLNIVMKGTDKKLYENRGEGWVKIN